MRSAGVTLVMRLGLALTCVTAAIGQGRGGFDWITAGADAQRSSWVRTDPKIFPDSMAKPGFALVWKMKLAGEPSMASTLDRYIGHRGFRSYAFMGSKSGEITAIDTDLGRLEWKKVVPGSSAPPSGSGSCAGGMTANVVRPATAAMPGAGAGRGGGNGRRAGVAKSSVGQPLEGAVTISEVAALAGAARGGGRAPGGGRGQEAAGPFGARVTPLLAISSDGMLHAMYVANGEEAMPPVPFLHAGANVHGFIVVDNIAYAATAQGCGGVPNGIWALDIAARQTVHWTPGGDIAGSAGFAFGPDGTVYAATSGGELAALDPKTLQVKGSYKSGGSAFTSSPVVFEYKTKTLIAVAAQDGKVHLVDTASLSGAGHTAAASGELASWEDAAGTRWLVAPSKSGIAAWKLAEQGNSLTLQPGWSSREMPSPLSPIVVNGIVFAAANSSSPVLYGLDGATGRELWNSSKIMTAPVRQSGISGSGSQIYLGTSDGTIYAFGFPTEH